MEKISDLTDFIATLPGLGPRSAKRIFFTMMKDNKRMMYRLSELLKMAADSVVLCDECCSYDIKNPCTICSDSSRDQGKLCIVTEAGDLWNVENSGHYHGYYYVLGGVLSTSANQNFTSVLQKLFNRIDRISNISEIIIATNATVDNQTTAFFLVENIKEHLIAINKTNTTITTLGQGMPIGSELDYLDEGTIGAAFRGRKNVE